MSKWQQMKIEQSEKGYRHGYKTAIKDALKLAVMCALVAGIVMFTSGCSAVMATTGPEQKDMPVFDGGQGR